jgi:hypothetical protein
MWAIVWPEFVPRMCVKPVNLADICIISEHPKTLDFGSVVQGEQEIIAGGYSSDISEADHKGGLLVDC